MQTGLFGKMPAHGDFVRRGLPRSFVAPWDAWLSDGIHAARAALGEGWDAAWEAAPVWRFRLSAGACGPDSVVGVMATSGDSVGRQFPLTLAAILPGAAVPPPDDWYEALEAALQEARAGGKDADALAARLPPPPADDPDATLDGRSLFWCAGQPARRMPVATGFVELLAHAPTLVTVGMPGVGPGRQGAAPGDAQPGTPAPLPVAMRPGGPPELRSLPWAPRNDEVLSDGPVATAPGSGVAVPMDHALNHKPAWPAAEGEVGSMSRPGDLAKADPTQSLAGAAVNPAPVSPSPGGEVPDHPGHTPCPAQAPNPAPMRPIADAPQASNDPAWAALFLAGASSPAASGSEPPS